MYLTRLLVLTISFYNLESAPMRDYRLYRPENPYWLCERKLRYWNGRPRPCRSPYCVSDMCRSKVQGASGIWHAESVPGLLTPDAETFTGTRRWAGSGVSAEPTRSVKLGPERHEGPRLHPSGGPRRLTDLEPRPLPERGHAAKLGAIRQDRQRRPPCCREDLRR